MVIDVFVGAQNTEMIRYEKKTQRVEVETNLRKKIPKEMLKYPIC